MDNIAWGRAGSPLIVGDLVVVPAGGPSGGPFVSLVAYDRETGREAWRGGQTQISYASPSLFTLERRADDRHRQRVERHRPRSQDRRRPVGRSLARLEQHRGQQFASRRDRRSPASSSPKATAADRNCSRSLPTPTPNRAPGTPPTCGPCRATCKPSSPTSSATPDRSTDFPRAFWNASTKRPATGAGKKAATVTARSCWSATRSWSCPKPANWRSSPPIPSKFEELAKIEALEGKTWNNLGLQHSLSADPQRARSRLLSVVAGRRIGG